jgi:hypothetical protein
MSNLSHRVRRTKPATPTATPPGVLQRAAVDSEQVQEAPPIVDQTLRTSGQPLDLATRTFMEQRFAHDFSGVRVHSDASAAKSARDVSAHAFTLGNDIVFGAGRFASGTHEGRRLIAHELTHVVQANATASNQAIPPSSVESLEGETRLVASTINSSEVMPSIRGSAPGLAVPLREGPDDPVNGTFGNLPQDEPDPGARRRSELVEEDGRWYEKLPSGQKWRARGGYDFVVQNGRIWAVKGSSAMGGPNAGHTEAAQGGRVEYAGRIQFGSSDKARGTLKEWSNSSGHYAPVRYFAKDPGTGQGVGGLPLDKFKAEEGGFPDKGPQLPVIQPRKGETFVPRDSGGTIERPGTPQTGPGPIDSPPDWVTAKPPIGPTAPPAVVATNDPRTVGQLSAPRLVEEYRSQQLLYQFSRTALDNLEAKEDKARALGTELSEEDIQAKATLTAQVAAAQVRILQARKDYEMLYSPAATPQQLQEVFVRRGLAIPVAPQTDKSGQAELNDSGISAWGLDDKGFTKKTGTATTRTVIGPDGKPVAITDEDSSSTNIGMGIAKHTTGIKVTTVGNHPNEPGKQAQGETPTVVDTTKSANLDLIKGEASVAKERTKERTDDVGTTTKTVDRTTLTAGVGGITKTKEDSTQVGSKLDSKSASIGVAREPGQLSIGLARTKKAGTMVGPPGQEKIDTGTERSSKLTGGVVSDEKGTGIGGLASRDHKTLLGDGKSVGTTSAAGGRCQVLLKEVPGSEPPRFQITTTISFDVKLGATVGKEWEAKPDAQKNTGLKGNMSGGVGGSIGGYASFKRELLEAEAKDYIEFVKANGHGSKLPEHKILATGAAEGWEAAKRLWKATNGSPELLKSMKAGEEVETNLEVGADAKLGAGGGESRQGGLSVGGEANVKAKRKINVKKTVMADGKIQITAMIDDEGDLGFSGSGGIGAASIKIGKSWTKGQGRAIVFVLDPKNPAFDSQLETIDAAATPEEIDGIAAQNRSLVASKTDKKIEGEGTTVGASVGPLAIDMGGKRKLASEVTRDQEGNVIGSKFTGENQGGGTIGIRDTKIGDSKTETYIGEVDKEGHAKGELSQTKKSTSVSKTVLNAGGKITSDPLGTLMSPGKLIDEETEQKGTAIADPEVMSVCYAALDKSKWDWKVGGHRHDDWVKAGRKIRNACSVRGSGRTAEIINVDKNAVQQALAEWTAADVEGRKDVLDALIRPLGGIPGGKAFAFPDGTESMKADWDALVVVDPLEGARAKLAAKKPQDALAEMQAVKVKLSSLHARIHSAARKWDGIEIQHSEMLGHINTRINEVDSEIRDVAKTIPAPAKPGAPEAITTIPTAAEVKEQEGRDRANEARGDLETYNNNIGTMKGYADTVFQKLGQAEAKINSWMGRVSEATPMIKEAEDMIKLWEALYWPTFRLYEKWSPQLTLDRSRIEKLHPAGARGRWREVYDLTRDKSMPARPI